MMINVTKNTLLRKTAGNHLTYFLKKCIFEKIVWYYEEKRRRSYIVEMLDAVNLPLSRTLKKILKCDFEKRDNYCSLQVQQSDGAVSDPP